MPVTCTGVHVEPVGSGAHSGSTPPPWPHEPPQDPPHEPPHELSPPEQLHDAFVGVVVANVFTVADAADDGCGAAFAVISAER
jgi:hypothetical protein